MYLFSCKLARVVFKWIINALVYNILILGISHFCIVTCNTISVRYRNFHSVNFVLIEVL